eukprot:GHRQ01009137.1.p1 GENE.GHRQ01009137.1~~GHRQ01009137.1.p1  ORF type:complete len:502 (+),score=117.22 GHRQ01009137.1:176-1681(+)
MTVSRAAVVLGLLALGLVHVHAAPLRHLFAANTSSNSSAFPSPAAKPPPAASPSPAAKPPTESPPPAKPSPAAAASPPPKPSPGASPSPSPPPRPSPAEMPPPQGKPSPGASPSPPPKPSPGASPSPAAFPPPEARPPQQSGNGSCTPARSFSDAMHPFCFVPETASPQARQFLSNAAATGPGGLGGVRIVNSTDVAKLRQFYYSSSINGSNAAQRQFLQATRNDSVAGVPVVFGMLKGTKNSSTSDTQLLVYLHGGGYVIGSCYHQWSTVAPTAAAAGLTILCIEYSLAPEHPFPADVNDVVSVYKGLLQRGFKGSNMVLLGDSAGGGLVAAVAIQLQREGLALPAALGMFSPLADMSRQLDTAATLAGVDPILPGGLSGSPEGTGMADLGKLYVGGKTTRLTDWLASPLRADYAAVFGAKKMPAVLIQVGLREVLLSDAVLLYHKMKEAAPGPGHVLISPYDAMWHVFQAFYDMPEAQAAAKEMGAFFVAALKGNVCPA